MQFYPHPLQKQVPNIFLIRRIYFAVLKHCYFRNPFFILFLVCIELDGGKAAFHMPEDRHQCPVKNIVTEKARQVKKQDALPWYIAASSSGFGSYEGTTHSI